MNGISFLKGKIYMNEQRYATIGGSFSSDAIVRRSVGGSKVTEKHSEREMEKGEKGPAYYTRG